MSQATTQELLRALTSRASKLAELVRDLRGPLGSARPSLRAALDLVEGYPAEVLDVANQELARAADEKAQIATLTVHLNNTNALLNLLEQFLSHGTRRELSESLADETSAALADLNLGHLKVVLSHGEANNYSTWTGDLGALLFGALRFGQPSPMPDHYALFRLPRLEGAGVQWRPILLGHEVAHGAVSAYNTLASFDLASKFDLHAAEQIASPLAGPNSAASAKAKALHRIAQNWAIELLCDAYALRQYGPAAVASLAEFFVTIGANDAESTTHPPGSLRVRVLLDLMGVVSDSRLASIVEPWQDQAAGGPPVYSEPWRAFLAKIFLDHSSDLATAAATLPGTAYNAQDRVSWIHNIADCLIQGRPADVIRSDPELSTEELARAADIVNSAWIARVENAVTPIDNLALKTIESLTLVTAWQENGGELLSSGSMTALQASLDAGSDPASTGAGLLSAADISTRLAQSDDSKRLIITPRLHEPKDSGIDLRLGHRFIVFRRSGVSTFDPLDKTSDPRAVQFYTELSQRERFVLHPQEIVLGATLEYMVLPPDLSGQVITRSSYGRLGLLTATAVQVHARFHGCLTLELVNLGTIPITLTPGERIAQLILWQSTAPVDDANHTYAYPIGPEFSRVREDHESEVLRGMRGT